MQESYRNMLDSLPEEAAVLQELTAEEVIMEKAGIPGISVAMANSDGITSTMELGTVSSTRCGLLQMLAAPNKEMQDTFNKSYYILTAEGLLYYNKSRGELEKIALDASQLKKLCDNFAKNAQIDILSDQQLREISDITDHAHSSPSADVNAETVFGAASLSKPVLAYLVLKLIAANAGEAEPELGKFRTQFDLDTPLYKIFPNMLKKFRDEDHERAKQLTARMVLSHTTGLPITHGEGPIKFQFEPGTKYGYSGPGIACLQEAIEALTGVDLEALAQEHIFGPLDMQHSSFATDKSKPPQAANSLYTTPSDYARFVVAWMKDEQLNYAFKPVVFMRDSYLPDNWPMEAKVLEIDREHVAWGLGVGLQTDNNARPVSAYHSGDMGEWRAWVAMDLNNKSAIVYMSNSHNGHILADQMISPRVTLLNALNYFFPTYGFARNLDELNGETNFHGLNAHCLKPRPLAEGKGLEVLPDSKENEASP